LSSSFYLNWIILDQRPAYPEVAENLANNPRIGEPEDLRDVQAPIPPAPPLPELNLQRIRDELGADGAQMNAVGGVHVLWEAPREQAQGEAEEANWNPMEWDRPAEELTWERLLGLDGSLVFLEHVFWVVSLNTLFIMVSLLFHKDGVLF